MNKADLESATRQINAALLLLRNAIKQYRSASDWAPPRFMLEKPAKKIPESALTETRVFSDRNALLASLPEGGRIAEVGTQHGNWAFEILQQKQPEELHLFDITFNLLREDVRKSPAIALHKGDSSSSLSGIEDGYFDWIYIDGDHSYQGVQRDIQEAVKKVKAGGLLVFNDYTQWSPMEAIPYGVPAAVNELLCSGWNMKAIALTHTGYWDVALQKGTHSPDLPK